MGPSSDESILNIVVSNINEGRLILSTITILLLALAGAMLADDAKNITLLIGCLIWRPTKSRRRSDRVRGTGSRAFSQAAARPRPATPWRWRRRRVPGLWWAVPFYLFVLCFFVFLAGRRPIRYLLLSP